MPSESSLDPASGRDVVLYVGEACTRAAQDEVRDLGGRVTHRFGEGVLIARVPKEADIASMKSALMEARTGLDSATQLACDAWNQNLTLKAMPLAPGAEEGAPWDAAPYQPPINFDEDPRIGESFAVDLDDEAGGI